MYIRPGYASALNSKDPMLIASRKPKRDKGSSNRAIGWIGIARPNPSNLKSSATIDPTSTTKPMMCNISTAGYSAGELRIERPSDAREHRALHGLTRSLVANMVVGVTEGFTRRLEINGRPSGLRIGLRVKCEGNDIRLGASDLLLDHCEVTGGQSSGVERVADLKGLSITGYYGIWLGLAPDDSPLLLRDAGSQDIYALDWEVQ